jgi:hypothetical protein
MEKFMCDANSGETGLKIDAKKSNSACSHWKIRYESGSAQRESSALDQRLA